MIKDIFTKLKWCWLGLATFTAFVSTLPKQDDKQQEIINRIWNAGYLSGAQCYRASFDKVYKSESSSIYNGLFTNQWQWNTNESTHFKYQSSGMWQAKPNVVQFYWMGTNVFSITNANLNDFR